jgi:glucose/arabinose dehydrogenase
MTQFNEVYYNVICEDLNQPWSLAEGPDGRLWVANNAHIVTIIQPDTDERTALKVQLPVRTDTMFAFFAHGLALHPQFPEQPYVYLSYMYVKKRDTITGHLDVVRLKYDANSKSLKKPLMILKDNHILGTMVMGGRLLTHENHLYVTTADERENGDSQDTNWISGKILRYNLDGSIPSDNPFEGNPVYSFGHRNPQGLAMHKGVLYSSEHGPSHNDEINRIVKGGNYGWPLVSGWGGTEEEKAVLKEKNIIGPIYAWTPTIACGSLGILERGGFTYFILTTLKEADVRLLELKDEYVDRHREIILFDEMFGRLRDVCASKSGLVYLLTYNRIQKNFRYGFQPNKYDGLQYDLLLEIFFDLPEDSKVQEAQF